MTFSDLLLKDLSTDDGPMFELLADLSYTALDGTGFSVPVGFLTDLASIPQPLWAILPPVGAYDRAAVVHDWLYRSGITTRSEADSVLLDGMTEMGVTNWKRTLIYLGVRTGGWKKWDYYRKQDTKLV